MTFNFKEFKNKLFSDLTVVPEIFHQKHLPSLDGLRGISVIMVITSHVLLGTKYKNYVEGAVGVGVFFVISGFLITSLLLKEKITKGKISLKNFYIRRALRILPVAYLYLIVVKLLTLFLKFKVSTAGLLGAAFYIMNFSTFEWPYYHYWTLSIEEQFYIIFPIILVLSLNRYIVITVVLIFIMPVINILETNHVGIFYTNNTVHTAIYLIKHLFGLGTVSILIGSICSILVFKKIIVIEKLKSGYFLSFIIFAIAVAIRTKPTVTYAFNIFSLIFPLLIAYVVLLNLKGGNFMSRILNNSVLVKIGILSYSLYIWQQIFTNFRPWAGAFKYSNSMILNLIGLFIVAYISYNFFEKKFLLLKGRFK